MLTDVAIIGGGAAGLNAALVLGRALRNVIVLDDGTQRNRGAREMHGFLSRDNMPPGKLLSVAREQLKPYESVRIVAACADDVTRDGDDFVVATGTESFRARRILLATGMRDELPELEGLEACWGTTAFTCPYCDGWEMRDKRIATWGTSRTSVELAQEIALWSRDLVVCAGLHTLITPQEREWLQRTSVPFYESPLRRLRHDDGVLRALEFEDGSVVERDAIFFSAPLVQRSPLPERIGCATNARGHIAVDDESRTSVSGVYAAGDAVTHLHQVIIAAASGVRAAIAINNDLLSAYPPL